MENKLSAEHRSSRTIKNATKPWSFNVSWHTGRVTVLTASITMHVRNTGGTLTASMRGVLNSEFCLFWMRHVKMKSKRRLQSTLLQIKYSCIINQKVGLLGLLRCVSASCFHSVKAKINDGFCIISTDSHLYQLILLIKWGKRQCSTSNLLSAPQSQTERR